MYSAESRAKGAAQAALDRMKATKLAAKQVRLFSLLSKTDIAQSKTDTFFSLKLTFLSLKLTCSVCGGMGTSVGSVYAREKRKSDQTGLVPILNIWVSIVGG